MDIIQKAVTLHDEIGSLTVARRQKLLAEVLACIDEVPASFQCKLLQVMVREKAFANEGDVTEWLNIINPWPSGLLLSAESSGHLSSSS